MSLVIGIAEAACLSPGFISGRHEQRHGFGRETSGDDGRKPRRFTCGFWETLETPLIEIRETYFCVAGSIKLIHKFGFNFHLKGRGNILV